MKQRRPGCANLPGASILNLESAALNLKVGIVYPQTEYPVDPGAVRDFAQTAEGLGFSHILAYDHVLGADPDRPGGWAGPYTWRDPFQEPFALFSYLSGLTNRIGFTTGVLVLPQRQTALVAKQAATVDVLSGGRLRLGVAIGWNPVEYEALGEDFSTRGRRSAEQVELLRKLWTEPVVTFHGRWHTVEAAGINPLPVQRPIPIWFGGHADAVLARVAHMGDGWMPNYRLPSEARTAFLDLDTHLAAHGRTRAEIGIEARLQYDDGSPDTWRWLAEEWQQMGATHLTCNTMRAGLSTASAHIAAMARYAEALL